MTTLIAHATEKYLTAVSVAREKKKKTLAKVPLAQFARRRECRIPCLGEREGGRIRDDRLPALSGITAMG